MPPNWAAAGASVLIMMAAMSGKVRQKVMAALPYPTLVSPE
jgi:hypothetical protein